MTFSFEERLYSTITGEPFSSRPRVSIRPLWTREVLACHETHTEHRLKVLLGQLVVGEALEPLRLDAVEAVLWLVGVDEVFEVLVAERVLLQREVHVRAQVVHPDRLCPQRLGGRFAIEEEDIRLHALRAEDT